MGGNGDMRTCLIVSLIPVFILLGIIVPKIVIPDVQADTDATGHAMARYARVRVSNIDALQRLVRTKLSVVEIRPDPGGCDWGYREPITGTAVVRGYTLWGIPLETWEVTCDSEKLVSAP